jgi:chromosome segregation protein
LHFARLRLSGFKSFADPAEVTIAAGLTGIVGPNGCGKSNLVEALRWAMGENSARRMRGQEMDDVIFGGTVGRAARNIAEVVLTLDNADRTVPGWGHADTIEVTRRIERGVGSDFRINGRPSRARDVQLLFQDGASGPASPALVGQGRVAALIAAKPSDRRLILEEAAGVTGLHSRRHEAELRLKAADENLLRLDDVLAGLAAQLGGLRRQARQAARYRTLSDRIRKAEAILLDLARRRALAAVDAARAGLSATRAAEAERAAAVGAAAVLRTAAAADLPDRRRDDADAAAALQAVLVERDALEGEAARLAEATRDAERRLAQIRSDTAREEALAADAAGALARLDEEAARIRRQSEGEGAARDAAATALAESRRAVDGLDAAATEAAAAVAADEARRQALQRRGADLEKRSAEVQRRLRDAEAGKRALDADAAGALDEVAARAAAAAAEAAEAEMRRRAEEAEAERQKADAAWRTAEAAFAEAQAAAVRLAAEAAGLQAALGEGGRAGGAPILDALTVRAGDEAAFGAALGADGAASADGSSPVHWRALPPVPDAPPLPPEAEPLAPRASVPSALARLLSQTGIVADAATAAALMPALRPGQTLVTRDGGAWRWDGLVTRADAPSPAAARLVQRRRLDAVSRDRAAADAASGDARTAASAAQVRAAMAQEGEKAARRALQTASADLARARDAAARAAEAATRRRLRLAALEEGLARAAGEAAEIDAQRAALATEAATLPDAAVQRRQAAAARATLADSRQSLTERQAALDRVEREAAGRRHRARAIEGERGGWVGRARSSEERLAELARRQAEAETALAALREQPQRIAGRRTALLDRLAQAEDRRRAAADALARAEERQREADRAARMAEAALAEARESRLRAEAAVDSARTGLAAVEARIAERLGIAPDAVAALAGDAKETGSGETGSRETADEAAVAARLDALMREREGIGPVNLRAEVEIAEIEQRAAALGAEKADLAAAIAKLRHAIATLNREARDRLTASFDRVDGQFRALFVRLFGGGSARLTLTDADDPLATGLEIHASPPGKKLQHLSLLSGGEQALTALALIFAAFLTAPAPICVLDEVDAPLDDANVDRLCTLLADLAAEGRTRFLVITHHRMTMARVDRLYGVTMAERGISRLVSVDLQQAVRHARPHQRELAV